jgi:pantetheine-phosphate adenylyltransferase
LASATIAVYPGSFDPITNGHIDLIDRGRHLFGKVIIAVLRNPSKTPLFPVEQRMELIQQVYHGVANVEVDAFEGLLVDYCRRVGASAIVRGLRAVSDFEYEFQMALMNRRLSDSRLETVFMMPNEVYTYVSSALIKEIAALGGTVDGLVPPLVAAALRQRLARP